MFFILIKKNTINLGSKGKCGICNQEIGFRFNPMEEWGMGGPMCGKCYSKRLGEHYPGDHARVNKDLD